MTTAIALALNKKEYIFPVLRNFHKTAINATPKTNTKIIEIGNGII
jgi:hypothetical protein